MVNYSAHIKSKLMRQKGRITFFYYVSEQIQKNFSCTYREKVNLLFVDTNNYLEGLR